ncbi:FAD-binding domain-containing protein [Cucurbitaria berberidis CBS 394.84]|uniref:FAD-binding domain-containing protein n=1 Tax=Cucurbitaria berberidis CBS 394.84 TaxID=1168544 RepID=A0A9P4LDF2_9PLEO|nr:FAD-binding domain-containing protein [Cucurbitaria berberidis CBS 394.84]KAF1850327.1 FAD-binding domain-containing protein [Cucurbitaria berberidis CBS 394.84]
MKSFAPTLAALLSLYEAAQADSNSCARSNAAPAKDQVKLANCCKTLQDAGLTHVLYEGDEEYKARTASYWSVSAQLTPGCIVQPTSTEEVSLALKTLSGYGASDCQFAVRSGGHTTWAGSNNIDNGLTIDLGLMNTTTYNEAENLAKIQPGNRWGMVYGALEPHGVTVGGGRASSVGVAGFLTGGGNSFFTAHRGFACDQVQNYEVVLGSGEIINANAENNSDLFRALKGGSGNFGIVTRFDMQTFKQGNLWGGSMVYSKEHTQAHIDAYTAWVDNVENYPDGSSIIFWTYLPALKDVAIIAAYEDVAGNVAPAGFDKFMAINHTSSTMRLASHKNLTDELEQASGYRDIWFTMTFKNNPRIFKHIVDAHQKFVDEWKAGTTDHDFITQCMFQAIPTIFAKHSEERGGNVLGLEREKDNAIMLLSNIAVKGGSDTEARARTQLRAYGEELQAFAAAQGGSVEWQFMNYADSYQNPLGSYGAENVAKIKAASAKYDPKGIFQTRCPGGFKISKLQDATLPRREL